MVLYAIIKIIIFKDLICNDNDASKQKIYFLLKKKEE
jgi:hypothetical protein